ncbi:Protein of unknown function [Pyronema omphalodes CBS 100304]|uniref:Uncharacterized protein n=1 Tax=Pyronema omphalodes (strain CBS 100304) TaxID=1076935 RepID=U4LC14_PYROM|nr:Protein of unknown function [Pyronema omphalodes CBS 100304]
MLYIFTRQTKSVEAKYIR